MKNTYAKQRQAIRKIAEGRSLRLVEYGTPGMRWGIRKNDYAYHSGKRLRRAAAADVLGQSADIYDIQGIIGGGFAPVHAKRFTAPTRISFGGAVKAKDFRKRLSRAKKVYNIVHADPPGKSIGGADIVVEPKGYIKPYKPRPYKPRPSMYTDERPQESRRRGGK
jgi:hypothetical protein